MNRAALPCLLLLTAAALSTAVSCRSAVDYRYYVLTAKAESGAVEPGGPVIGLGPFAWPRYLDRPQIVTRRSGTELHLDEVHRWAEPLEENFLAVLAAETSRLSGSERVVVFPWTGQPQLDCRVRGDVLRFDAGAEGEAVLTVAWRALRATDGSSTARQSSYRSSAPPGDYGRIAAALSETVAAFAADVTAACTGS